ncbi:hypothetical protein ACH0R4_RS21710, partial [Bacillus cytotoxicus]|nr:type I restriction enzyme HsdR N-terminal domain-containing protein [Bacillus cytotoxicus]
MIEDKKKNVVAVEVKKRAKLNDQDILQLAGYLNIESIRWGILTNGVEWILLNHDIKGEFKDKIVFRINLFSNKIGDYNSEYLFFFNYNNLFETAKTNYYRDIQQFKKYVY